MTVCSESFSLTLGIGSFRLYANNLHNTLASPRVEHMNQNMPIYLTCKDTFAKYTDIQIC